MATTPYDALQPSTPDRYMQVRRRFATLLYRPSMTDDDAVRRFTTLCAGSIHAAERFAMLYDAPCESKLSDLHSLLFSVLVACPTTPLQGDIILLGHVNLCRIPSVRRCPRKPRGDVREYGERPGGPQIPKSGALSFESNLCEPSPLSVDEHLLVNRESGRRPQIPRAISSLLIE